MKGWEWITAARVITAKPCRLLGLVVTPSLANSECKVYDGESADSPAVMEIFLTTKNTKIFEFTGGLHLDRGLYVGSFTNITGVLVRWEV